MSRKSGDGLAALPPRARIIAAARELFQLHGTHAVGVDAIAEAALTNKMTLYRHFGSKDELVVECLRLIAREGEAVWDEIAAAHPGDPDAQLEDWLDRIDRYFREHPGRGCTIANAAIELMPDHPARVVIEDYKRGKRERLLRLFRAARYPEPARLADEVVLMLEGARVSLQSTGPDGPCSRLAAMLRGLLRNARARRDAATKPSRISAREAPRRMTR